MALFINPLGIRKYKIITYQEGINALIERSIVSRNNELLDLGVFLTGSSLYLKGIVKEPELKAKNIRLGNIHFSMKLVKEEIHDHKVFLRIVKYRVWNPDRRFSLLKIIDLYTKVFRKKILEGLAHGSSPIIIAKPLKKLIFNLNFLFYKIPSEVRYLGKIRVLNVGFEKGKIVWYLESNVIMKSIIDFIGRNFIEVEQIDEHIDPQRLLTDFLFDAADTP